MTTLESRLAEADPLGAWDCLAVDLHELRVAERATWVAVTVDVVLGVAAVAWASPAPIIDRVVARAHVISFAGREVASHECGDVSAIERAVDTLARNTSLRGASWPSIQDGAIGVFYSEGIAGRRLAHDGDPIVRQHVDNVALEMSEDGPRIWKRSSSVPIVAVSAIAGAFRDALVRR